MADALIPVFTGTLADRTIQLCCARTLHEFMQVKRDFTTWVKGRIRKFGFMLGEDFITVSRSPELGSGNRGASTDYHLTLDMAKELSMVENNEQGRAARRYFIACERQALAVAQPTPYTVQPSDTLSETQQIALRAMLESNVKRLPHAQQAGAMKQGWGKLFSHFKVPYRQIPASEFTEALSILSRHVAQWELVDESPAARTASAMADAVRQHVLRELQAKPDWKLGRWQLTFNLGREGAQPSVRMLEHDECIAGPGKLPVDRRKLAAIFHDLGSLQRRVDGLGVLESDLPPSWWDGNAISAG